MIEMKKRGRFAKKIAALLLAGLITSGMGIMALADDYNDDYVEFEEYDDEEYYEDDYYYDDDYYEEEEYYYDDEDEYSDDEDYSDDSDESNESDDSNEESEPEKVSADDKNKKEKVNTEVKMTIPQKSEEFYIYDETGSITENTKKDIFKVCDYLSAQYGSQVVVVVVNSVNGANMESYTDSILKEWNVGGKGGYGIALVMSVKDDDYYCVSNTGLRELFTSEELQKIMDEKIEPYFAAKDYNGAAKAFVDEASTKIEPYMTKLIESGVSVDKSSIGKESDDADELGDENTIGAVTTKKKSSGLVTFVKWLLIIVIIIVVLAFAVLAVFMVRNNNIRKNREAQRRRQQRREPQNSKIQVRTSQPSRQNAGRPQQRSQSGNVRTARPQQSRPADPLYQPSRQERSSSPYARPQRSNAQRPQQRPSQRPSSNGYAPRERRSDADAYRDFLSKYDRK